MAIRRFALPDIQNLSKEQERARLLPREGCHLIVGGPGTGKSIIALLRTRQHHRPKGAQEYVFLVYNRLLLEASRELVGNAVNAHPWKTWFKSMYKRALGQTCPVIGGQAFTLDWDTILKAITEAPEIRPPLTPFVIIDEGQDMPAKFYQALIEIGFERCFVVADQNQRITDEHSSIQEIATELVIDPEARIELTDNYRNCDRIARLALALCIEDPASPCLKLPLERRCTREPLLINYGPDCAWDFDGLIRRILKAADRDPARLYGIITPDNATRLRWLSALHSHPVAPELDHGRPRIVTYVSGDEEGDHRFGLGGIFVINAQSAKGLEFDTVLLADIDGYCFDPESRDQRDDLKRRFYVMISRAREHVVLLRRAGHRCPVDEILPLTDPSLLVQLRCQPI
jgi:DNA helicase II / ATP-dependent DNA helicase PcrA